MFLSAEALHYYLTTLFNHLQKILCFVLLFDFLIFDVTTKTTTKKKKKFLKSKQRFSDSIECLLCTKFEKGRSLKKYFNETKYSVRENFFLFLCFDPLCSFRNFLLHFKKKLYAYQHIFLLLILSNLCDEKNRSEPMPPLSEDEANSVLQLQKV